MEILIALPKAGATDDSPVGGPGRLRGGGDPPCDRRQQSRRDNQASRGPDGSCRERGCSPQGVAGLPSKERKQHVERRGHQGPYLRHRGQGFSHSVVPPEMTTSCCAGREGVRLYFRRWWSARCILGPVVRRRASWRASTRSLGGPISFSPLLGGWRLRIQSVRHGESLHRRLQGQSVGKEHRKHSSITRVSKVHVSNSQQGNRAVKLPVT